MYANQYPRANHAAQIPTGWQPPYQGAPPIPQGWNVKQNDWNQGQWQFNPSFNHHHQQPSQQYIPWIPSQSWAGAQQQQQQQQQHNPYQRPIKPPSAEYLAQPVKENALDLTGMVPRAQVYGEENSDDEVPHTPWIWNPRGLVEKEDDQGTIQAEFRDALGNRFLQSRGPTPTRRRSSLEHEAPPSPSPLRLQRHTSTRQSSEPSPQIYAAVPAPRRGASEPPVTQLSSYSQQSRHSSPERQQPQQQEQRLLQPTFSTNIVRTPDHYSNSSPTRPSSSATSPGHISRKSSRSNSVDPELAAKMDRLSTGPTQPVLRQSSLPTHSISSTSSTIHASAPIYTEEPSALLSPLVLSHTPALPNRSLGRHHTAPMLSSIPETATRGMEPFPRTDVETLSRSIQRTSPRHTPETTSPRSRTSPHSTTVPSPYSNVIPSPNSNVIPSPHSSRSSRSSSSRHRISSSSSGSRRTSPMMSHNPLPEPPREFQYSLPPPRQKTPPKTYKKKARMGFWNRRGDHLTPDGHVVYAPPHLSHPAELKNYPRTKDGYMNHEGAFMKQSPNWTELQDSLPRFGRPPVRPYESVSAFSSFRMH
ncbi:hypothetical protein EDD85DRAFT_775196 [Armillaria nabsnona]|nr:hypothetical protein EDD85DRAFT_775196 [Armillaria nabsnona]